VSRGQETIGEGGSEIYSTPRLSIMTTVGTAWFWCHSQWCQQRQWACLVVDYHHPALAHGLVQVARGPRRSGHREGLFLPALAFWWVATCKHEPGGGILTWHFACCLLERAGDRSFGEATYGLET